MSTTEVEKQPAIYAALAAIMREIGVIGADHNAPDKAGGWSFRAARDVVDSLHPLLAKHGVWVKEKVLDLQHHTFDPVGRQNNRSYGASVTIEFTLQSHVDGSEVVTQAPGWALDSSDKALGKAITYAFKTAMSHLFVIPFANWTDTDEDYPTPEATEKPGVYHRAMNAMQEAKSGAAFSAIRKQIDKYVQQGELSEELAGELHGECDIREKDVPRADPNSGRKQGA